MAIVLNNFQVLSIDNKVLKYNTLAKTVNEKYFKYFFLNG